jgi:Transposase and inactivated derivatives
MPYAYASQFRAMVVEQVRDGQSVTEVAASLEVPVSTVFRWVRQDRVDRGELEGRSTDETAELRAARRRIAELEAELATVRRASELFAEGRVVPPKALFKIVETLAREGHGTKRVCRLLRVAPSGFFRQRCASPSDRVIRRAWLTDVIAQIHAQSRGTYGVRRIRAELTDAYAQRVNKKLIASIMRELGIVGLPARRKGKPNLVNRATTTDFVNREFHRDGPNQLWMTDITEHPTREGKVYCCAVLDAWSRRVVGWSIDRRPTAAMVNAALGMAVEQRRPADGAPGDFIADLPVNSFIHPAGRPINTSTIEVLRRPVEPKQYTSWTFSQRVRAAGLVQSLGTVGDAFDNAVVEAFWGRMQTELLNRRKWNTRIQLTSAIFDWIEVFYNRVRRHSSLGYMSPIAYEKLHTNHAKVA